MPAWNAALPSTTTTGAVAKRARAAAIASGIASSSRLKPDRFAGRSGEQPRRVFASLGEDQLVFDHGEGPEQGAADSAWVVARAPLVGPAAGELDRSRAGQRAKQKLAHRCLAGVAAGAGDEYRLGAGFAVRRYHRRSQTASTAENSSGQEAMPRVPNLVI